jgi:hypothetical protein
MLAEVDVPGPLPHSWDTATLHDFRTYFITLTTYSYTTMHYNVTDKNTSFCRETLHSAA